jgi:transposase
MSAPLPDALRARFQRYIEEGLSGRAAALRLKRSPATGARWALAIRRTGRAEAAPQGRPKGKGKLAPRLQRFSGQVSPRYPWLPRGRKRLLSCKKLPKHAPTGPQGCCSACPCANALKNPLP